jgi:sulfatase modifying factor 1
MLNRSHLVMLALVAACQIPNVTFTPPISCVELAETCGNNDSCCNSPPVMEGTYFRSYDVASDGTYADKSFPATVSRFRLDKYEVTVGRFRAFVNAGMGTQQSPPMPGAGAHANIAGSGWDSAWNTSLVASTAALKSEVAPQCIADPGIPGQGMPQPAWTAEPGGSENKPMNCVMWYEAMAFCLWDGGYLPTEAEWNYAASGGSEQRVYPWSNPPISENIDCEHANYKKNDPPGAFCVNDTTGGTDQVGHTSSTGDGKWGHSDLAGNLWEWALDWYTRTYPMPCIDCANLNVDPNSGNKRVIRGGSFYSSPSRLRPGYRDFYFPDKRYDFIGVRCARTP